MWPFRRRAKGRHQLGAAVTSIPSLVRTVPAPVYLEPEPVAYVEPEPLQVVETAQATPVEGVAEAAVAPEPRQQRIELGFRDGSTAALAPGSEQAKALSDLASVLTQRD